MATMKDLAALLGVEIGEEFVVSCIDLTYRFTDTTLEYLNGKNWIVSHSQNLIFDLFSGKRRIIKKTWKPKLRSTYLAVFKNGPIELVWSGDSFDQSLYAVGNCFRTQEEAEKHKDEVLAKLNEIYDSGKPLLEW